ncbi:hypothetical protein DBR11_06430 [Pedobacter sp. HMWF019]|nr:hypothetical protein DBR11_06430 [Pedobacter sp. HMWF019]
MAALNTTYLWGKWHLVSFKLVFLGLKWNWGGNATGFIAYDKEASVKVDIKAEKKLFPSIASLMFNNILTYGGNYEIKDNCVIHRLDYCSKKSWLGKDLVRNVLMLSKQSLILQGGGKVFGVILSWAK